MTKFQFIAELRARLVALTNEERESAIKYYEEYFDDAGEENEQEVIKTLESPQKVAQQILSDYNKKEKSSSEFVPLDPNNPVEANNEQSENQTTNTTPPIQPKSIPEKKPMSGGMIALIVVLCVIFSPAIIGLLGAAFGIIVGFIATFFSLYIAFASIVFSFIVAGVAAVVGGIVFTFTDPIVGLGAIGVGLLIGGIGIFLIVPFLWVTTKAIPAVCKGLVDIIAFPFRKISGKC